MAEAFHVNVNVLLLWTTINEVWSMYLLYTQQTLREFHVEMT